MPRRTGRGSDVQPGDSVRAPPAVAVRRRANGVSPNPVPTCRLVPTQNIPAGAGRGKPTLAPTLHARANRPNILAEYPHRQPRKPPPHVVEDSPAGLATRRRPAGTRLDDASATRKHSCRSIQFHSPSVGPV